MNCEEEMSCNAWLSSLTSSSRTSTSLYRDLALTSQLPGSRPTVRAIAAATYAVDLEKYRWLLHEPFRENDTS